MTHVTGEASDEVRVLAPDVETLARRLAAADYLVDEGLATSIFLALRLPQPLLLEGEAGVGKTEAAKALASALDTPLIRLQCYDGIDAAEALYEWNYPRQLLSIRLAEARGSELAEDELFGREYLNRRPLLRAIEHPGPRPAVLLIDEIDRADDEFEAFLLELLAEAAVTIPELGTIAAACISGSITPARRARSRSCADGCGAPHRPWPCRWPTRWRGCASQTSRSRRASPRRSTGWRR